MIQVFNYIKLELKANNEANERITRLQNEIDNFKWINLIRKSHQQNNLARNKILDEINQHLARKKEKENTQEDLKNSIKNIQDEKTKALAEIAKKNQELKAKKKESENLMSELNENENTLRDLEEDRISVRNDEKKFKSDYSTLKELLKKNRANYEEAIKQLKDRQSYKIIT